MSKVLVVYHSFTGKCQSLAEAAAEGARSAGAEVVVRDAAGVTAADLSAADAVIIGTPQPFGSVAGETKKLFERLWPEREKVGTGKPLGAFVCYGSTDPSGSFEFLEKWGSRFGLERKGQWVTAKRDEAEAGREPCRQLGADIATRVASA
jgi:flavodoxin